MDYLIKKSDSATVNLGGTVGKIKLPEQTGGDVTFVGDKRPLDLGDYILVQADITTEPLGIDQKRGPTDEIVDVGAQTVTVTHTAIDMTAQEIADRDLANDIGELRSGGKDIALVLIELIDYLLANTNMSATDFTPDVRQAYQDIKVIADRVKSQ